MQKNEETKNFKYNNHADSESKEGKPRKINKRKLAKTLRNQGQEYISPNTKKTIPAKYMKSRCDSEICKNFGKNCFEISDEQRRRIFDNFYNIGDLHLQREFLVRHLEVKSTSRSNGTSRRKHTITYKLTVNKKTVIICKKLFLNTLGITDKMCRTAISKLNEFGILEKDQRGGKQRSEKVREQEHLNKFPKHKKIKVFNS